MTEETDPLPGERTVVVGTSGAGKTTLARRLAEHLGIAHVELDALHWEPNWTPAPLDVFRERAARAVAGERWTADGNYSKVRDIVWGRADTLIWLDYAFPVVLRRLAARTLRRCLMGEELWNGNRERLREALFSRDSLLLWVLRTHWRRRRQYPVLFATPPFAHLRVICHRSPRETEGWLAGLPDGTPGASGCGWTAGRAGGAKPQMGGVPRPDEHRAP